MKNEFTKSQKISTTIGIMLVMFLASVDMLIVANALPTIAKDLTGGQYYTWVITTYTLVMTIIVPVAGKLTDIYGRKWIYITGILVFILGSALCGLSSSIYQLIAFRGFQGIGGGIIMGVSMATISDVYSAKEVGKYMGIIMSMSALASLIGPSLGGFLTDSLSWHWIFYINLPVGIAAVIMLWIGLPKLLERDRSKKVDYFGALLVALFTVPLMLALTWGGNETNGGYAWNSSVIISLLTVAVLALVALLITESKVKQPIIPLGFFKKPVYTVVNIANFFISIAMMSVMVYLPQFLQTLKGYSATKSGGLQTPMMVCLTIGSIAVGQLVSRLGKYKIFVNIGGVICLASCALLCTMQIGTSDTMIMFYMALFGFDAGIFFSPLTIALRNEFDNTQLGTATASFQFYKNLATSIGVAVLGSVVTRALVSWKTAAMTKTLTTAINNNLMSSFKTVFIVCTIISAVVLLVSFFLREVPFRQDDKEEPTKSFNFNKYLSNKTTVYQLVGEQ